MGYSCLDSGCDFLRFSLLDIPKTSKKNNIHIYSVTHIYTYMYVCIYIHTQTTLEVVALELARPRSSTVGVFLFFLLAFVIPGR